MLTTPTARSLGERDEGFTLIEICIAIVILTAAILGVAASTGRMLSPTGDAELEFVALQSVEDRLAIVSLDPRYGLLDSIYETTETGLAGLPNISRATSITRTQTAMGGGEVHDFSTVVVTVSGGRLKAPVSRTLVVGAP